VAKQFVLSPGERLETLAGVEAEVLASVQTMLALRYRLDVKRSALADARKHIADLTEKLGQPDAVKDHTAFFQSIGHSLSLKNHEEPPLPEYFDDWCKATVDKIMMIIKQETDEKAG
jgi:hypothetical protein